ncbi:PQQ-binding-like beta-propeller repeat protein [Natronobeatus ordinarius]|uniref:outer membrane protein assembly factor BamB family protein n=1 Tax=Natronobeatus ordinarius TaxID=2963433 RepID=UPI0020CEDFBB|nr:PQQ-binding-like beta-propeller repeat protein [Natronobeatus ordinarius]
MSQQRLGRRDVLKLTAAGTVGALAFSSTTGARESPETQASDAGEKLWSFETDFGVMKSGPTIVDGTVYVGTRDGVLYVFDATTGEKQWEFLTEGIINPSPTVIDDTVYIASNDNSVYALPVDPEWEDGSAEEGDYLWRFETDERDIHYEDLNHIWGSPTVLDGTVYVGNNSGFVYAIDAETGEQEWRFDEPKDWITTSPTVVDGTVYIGAGWDETDKHLYAIDAETGEEEWRFQAEGDIASSATVADGTVYVGSHLTEQVDGEAAATSASPNIDPETGDLTEGVTTQQEWEYYGWLHAVDAEDGTEEWTVEADGWIRGSPTVADGTVYVGSNDGLLHALEAETGESEWTFATEGWIDESSPTVVNDTVFVADIGSEIGGSVYGIDTATGEKEWQFETEAAGFRSSPTVVDGVLYIGSDAGHGGEDSNMYAIDTHVDCSSNGSRVELGTHGHHNVWAEYAAEDSDGDVSDYADDDGNVQTDGLREAIDDWRGGDISTDLLRDVIDVWESS